MCKIIMVCIAIAGIAFGEDVVSKNVVSNDTVSEGFSPWMTPLIDQSGCQFKMGDFKDRYLLVTGLYTTCANPTKCPLVAKWVQESEASRLKSANKDKIRILVISFDPNDTPEMLAEYSRINQWGDGIVFAKVNGGAEEVETFFRNLGFRLSVGEAGVSIHAVQMKLYDPQRRCQTSSDREVLDWSKILENLK